MMVKIEGRKEREKREWGHWILKECVPFRNKYENNALVVGNEHLGTLESIVVEKNTLG